MNATSTKVYIAGPDVFSPRYREFCENMAMAAKRHGFEAVFPIDGEGLSSPQIYSGNLQRLKDCDMVLANLNPFRGHEPDSGTVVEVAVARAQGKLVYGVIRDGRPMADRILSCKGGAHTDADGAARDGDGYLIENFGDPLNVMLMHGVHILVGDMTRAFEMIAANVNRMSGLSNPLARLTPRPRAA